jgi:hypothetical protein
LKTEEELWSTSGRCSALELKDATRSFVMLLPLKDMSSILVSSRECKLQRRDLKLRSDRFSATTLSLALHRRHDKVTTIQRILVLWNHATVMVRMGTMLIGV